MCSDVPQAADSLSPNAAVSWCRGELPGFILETMNLLLEALRESKDTLHPATQVARDQRFLAHSVLCEKILASFGMLDQVRRAREIGAQILIASNK